MKTTRKMIGSVSIALLLAAAPLGCGETEEDHENNHHENNHHENNNHEEEAPPDHACEHAQNGPFVPADSESLQAATASDGQLPTISFGEWTTIDLSDEDGDGDFEGFVSFTAEHDGGYRFFTSVAWPGEDGPTTTDPYVVITSESASAPEFERKHPVGEDPGCIEVNFNHYYHDLANGEEYTLEFVDHPEERVSIVPVPEGEGGDHDHE